MEGIIFGGGGFIGSSIVSTLTDIDWIAVDDLSLGRFENIMNPNSENVRGDISDRKGVEKLIKDSPDFVMMMNGLSSNPLYHPDPRRGYETMLGGALNVFDACRRWDVKRVIYASSSSIYGNTPAGEQVETANVTPPNFYSCAKLAVENAAKVYSEAYGIATVGFRYFSVYGYPERHKGRYANVITQFIWEMLEGKSPLIYGDGEQTRDAVFISDVVEANRLAIEKDLKGANVFNIGTAVQTSFNRFVELINTKSGTGIKPRYTENPIHNYVFDTKADTRLARKVLGFEAKVGIEEGINKTVDYYKNH